MEKFGKIWGFAIGIAGVLVAVAGWLYNRGVADSSTQGRVFDSPEQKVIVVKHVEEGPTPEQRQRQLILDSINAVHAMKSRAKRDSLMAAEIKARKYADSINQLNADQLYQTKEELKQIKELLKNRSN